MSTWLYWVILSACLGAALVVTITLCILVRKSLFAPNLDVVIVSPGGGGTTYLLDYLHSHTNLRTNSIHDTDGLKHISAHQLYKLDTIRPKHIVYLMNDPALTIESHFQRNLAQTRLEKQGNPHHLNYLGDEDGREHYYQDCIASHKDLYGIDEQFESLVSGFLPCDVMCVDFNKLGEPTTRARLAKFLGQPTSIFDDLDIQSRHSSKTNLRAEYIKIYDELYSKMLAVHGQIIRPKSRYYASTKSGNSHRLGNLIDAWYFASLGSPERIKEFKHLVFRSRYESFGASLTMQPSFKLAYTPSQIQHLVAQAQEFWAVYDYANVNLTRPHFRGVLRSAMFKYASLHRRELLPLLNTPTYDCVIHYRVGDFIRLGQLIDYRKVADQAIQFRPERIAIMDGGLMHNASLDIIKQGKEILQKLRHYIEDQLPKVKIEQVSNDVDKDFFICASAPVLVTAGGSFAICAGIANTGIVRTPACKNTNFCQVEAAPAIIAKDWKTYAITGL